MLDEPFAGIDPKTVAEIQTEIRALAENRQALLAVARNPSQTATMDFGIHPSGYHGLP